MPLVGSSRTQRTAMAFAIEKGSGTAGTAYASATSVDSVDYTSPTAVAAASSHQLPIYDAFNPLEADIQVIQLNRGRGTLGREGFAPGRSLFIVRFKVYVFGRTLSAQPRWTELLRVCGFKKFTVTAKTTPVTLTSATPGAANTGVLPAGDYGYRIATVTIGNSDAATDGGKLWDITEMSSVVTATAAASGAVTLVFADPGSGKTTYIFRSRLGAASAGPWYLLGESDGTGFVDNGTFDTGLGPEYPGGTAPLHGDDADGVVGYWYLPRSDAHESGVAAIWLDGLYHSVKGVRGTMAFNAPAGQPVEVNVEMRGLYIDPAAAANPTFVSNPGIPPKYENALCTLTPEHDTNVGQFDTAFTPVLKNLGVNTGTQVTERLDANAANAVIELGIVQQFQAASTLSFEVDPTGAYNAIKKMNAGKSHYIRTIVGPAVAGQRFHFAVPKGSFANAPRYGDVNGYRTFDTELAAVGDDDWMALANY